MNVNLLLFGVYPYIAGTVFLVGSLVRYDREPYTQASYSTQLLGSGRSLAWGSNLWHVGVLFIFLGHFVGLLTPAFTWLHVPPVAHQWIAASSCSPGAWAIAMYVPPATPATSSSSCGCSRPWGLGWPHSS